MSRFTAKTRVFDYLGSVAVQNIIFERFRVIRPRSTFRESLLNESL